MSGIAGPLVSRPVFSRHGIFFWILRIADPSLDGGSALEAVLERYLGADRARYNTRLVSCVVGGLAALVALGSGLTWAGILCALFTYNNVQALRGGRGVRLLS